MSGEQPNWADIRRRLRRFQARSGWDVPEIGRVLRDGYAAAVPNEWVAGLISVETADPRRLNGFGPLDALLKTYQGKVPTFEEWLRRHLLSREAASIWDKQDAVTAVIVAREEARAAHVATFLAREGQRPEPPRDVLRELDAATIAVLSGGTIVARGVRL